MVVDLYQDSLQKLVGKELWGIVGGSGTGSIISLSIGEKTERKTWIRNPKLNESLRNNDPEYCLFIQCPWRIVKGNSIVCSSYDRNDDLGPYESGFNELIGRKIVSISSLSPAFDLDIEFEDSRRMRAFCTDFDKDYPECFNLHTPERIFGVELDGVVRVERKYA